MPRGALMMSTVDARSTRSGAATCTGGAGLLHCQTALCNLSGVQLYAMVHGHMVRGAQGVAVTEWPKPMQKACGMCALARWPARDK